MDLKVLQLVRTVPGPAGMTSPTGVVADAIVFPDGLSVLHWRTIPAGTEIYGDEAQLRSVRELSGRSHFEEA